MIYSSLVNPGVTVGIAYVVFTNRWPNNRSHATCSAGA